MKLTKFTILFILLFLSKASSETNVEFENWKNQFNFKSGNVLVSPNKVLHSKMLKMLRPLN